MQRLPGRLSPHQVGGDSERRHRLSETKLGLGHSYIAPGRGTVRRTAA